MLRIPSNGLTLERIMNYARAFINYTVERLIPIHRYAYVGELWAHRDGVGVSMGMSDPLMSGRRYRIDYLNWDMQHRAYCKRYSYRRRKFSNHLVPIVHTWHYSYTVE